MDKFKHVEYNGFVGIFIEAIKEQQKQLDAFAQSEHPEGAQLCLHCNTVAVVMMDGCMTCLSCGDSKCG